MISEKALEEAQILNKRKIANEVKEKRKERKLSKYQLSKEADVSYFIVQRIENEQNSNIDTLSKVLATLEINLLLI